MEEQLAGLKLKKVDYDKEIEIEVTYYEDDENSQQEAYKQFAHICIMVGLDAFIMTSQEDQKKKYSFTP